MSYRLKNIKSLVAGFLFFLFHSTQNAYAYLDLGAGSYFFQLIIAGLLGMLFLGKTFWKNLVGWLRKTFFKSRHGKNRR